MFIQIKCPECGRGGNVSDDALGRAVKCPGCGSKIIVTDSSAKEPGDFAKYDSFAPPQINDPAQTAVFRRFPRSRVQGPAIALIVTAVIGIGFSLITIVNSVVFLRAMPQINQNIGNLVENIEKQQQDKRGGAKEVQDALGLATSIASWSGTTGIIMSSLSIVGGGIVFAGALSMMSLRRYPLAIIGSVLAMIPMIGPCCVLGLPFGIWALVVLCQPDVRSAFSSQAPSA